VFGPKSKGKMSDNERKKNKERKRERERALIEIVLSIPLENAYTIVEIYRDKQTLTCFCLDNQMPNYYKSKKTIKSRIVGPIQQIIK
jgi:hypothetical protein